jgi:outer membrane protein assembly factor BamA
MPSTHTRTAAVLLVAAVVAPGRALAAQEPAVPADTAPATARTVVLPVLASAPETGVQYGATALRVWQPADTGTRPSSVQLLGLYTAKAQARLVLDVDRWTASNRWRALGRLEWQRFPLPYFGIGDDAPDAAEETYTPRGVLGFLTVQRRVRGPLYVFGGYRFQDLAIRELDPRGVLVAGTVPGSRGSRAAQLQAGLLHDSRDNIFASTRGSYAQLTLGTAADWLGSDFTFRRVQLDARHFVPLGDAPAAGFRRVLALQGVFEGTGGTAPFDQLSMVGNSNWTRGYVRGRFRDRYLLAGQAEYRAPWFFGIGDGWLARERLGYAVFAGGGTVAPRAGDLVSGARFLPSVGLGGRYLLIPRSGTTVRVDYAFGTAGQSGLYLSFNEAF